jgi:hypothetical protein
LLSFEEQYKNQNAHECYFSRYYENLTPLELFFFSVFIHYNTGKLRTEEQADAHCNSKDEALHRAENFLWRDSFYEELAHDYKKDVGKAMQ